MIGLQQRHLIHKFNLQTDICDSSVLMSLPVNWEPAVSCVCFLFMSNERKGEKTEKEGMFPRGSGTGEETSMPTWTLRNRL